MNAASKGKYREYWRGGRRLYLNMRITARLYESLRTAAANERPPVTVAKFVETGLWKCLGQVAARRLAILQPSGSWVVTNSARKLWLHSIKSTNSPSPKPSLKKHERAMFYQILAHLAEVNSATLRDASEEEIPNDLQKVREDQMTFEEATRKLEAETKDPAEEMKQPVEL